MKVDLFQYNLPEELIAQYPAEKRDGSRLLVVHRDTGIIEHRGFPDICEYIHKNDVLVLNDSKVIHARLLGVKRATDAAAEIFLIRAETAPGTFRSSGFDGASGTGGASGGYGLGTVWEVLAKPSKRLKPGEIVDFSDDFAAEMLGGTEDGNRFVRFFHKDASGQEISAETDLTETFDRLGKMPLPPYIRRQANETDEIRYQTVYSRIPGSVAAPTAGLHFTEETLAALRAKGAATAFVTLHVGLGTFRPVKVDEIEDHKMHTERFTIDARTADILNAAKVEGRRVICVGTTSVRTLESAAAKNIRFSPCESETNIFIYPGYRFKAADALLTNFHLPGSTLLMLVSAFAGRELMLRAYEEAVREKYRFFSYGDAMLIL